MSMLFQARSILHGAQRYPTTGDWLNLNGQIEIRVSSMSDWRMEMLVAVHELIEAVLCASENIPESVVSEYDKLYERARTRDASAFSRLREDFGCDCIITAESEPGDDIHAPYYKQHQLATSVERMLASELGVSWQVYEETNLALLGVGK